MEFKLDKEEEQAARAFIEKHNHSEEFRKAGKVGFSTLGMQFTYHITPGGLGDGIVIECNHCHAKEDITNIANW